MNDFPAPAAPAAMIQDRANLRVLLQASLAAFNTSVGPDPRLAARHLVNLYVDTTALHDDEFRYAWGALADGQLLDILYGRQPPPPKTLDEAKRLILDLLDRKRMGFQSEAPPPWEAEEEELLAQIEALALEGTEFAADVVDEDGHSIESPLVAGEELLTP